MSCFLGEIFSKYFCGPAITVLTMSCCVEPCRSAAFMLCLMLCCAATAPTTVPCRCCAVVLCCADYAVAGLCLSTVPRCSLFDGVAACKCLLLYHTDRSTAVLAATITTVNDNFGKTCFMGVHAPTDLCTSELYITSLYLGCAVCASTLYIISHRGVSCSVMLGHLLFALLYM